MPKRLKFPHRAANFEDSIDLALNRPSWAEHRPQLGTTSWPFEWDEGHVSWSSRTFSPDEAGRVASNVADIVKENRPMGVRVDSCVVVVGLSSGSSSLLNLSATALSMGSVPSLKL